MPRNLVLSAVVLTALLLVPGLFLVGAAQAVPKGPWVDEVVFIEYEHYTVLHESNGSENF
jgi:hypothetical protein